MRRYFHAISRASCGRLIARLVRSIIIMENEILTGPARRASGRITVCKTLSGATAG
jgi:hypothetical protein